MNKIILLGNLTKDPDARYTQNGKAMVRTSIAITSSFKNAAGERQTDFFNLLAWGKTAEFFGKYLKKGSRILVEGRLQNNHYEKNGTKYFSEDVVVENVEFAGGKKTENKSDDNFNGEEVPEENIPF